MTEGTSPDLLKYYAPGIADEALWAIARNAMRLLIDADVLFKSGRYAGAASSAILSIEESGKLIAIAYTGKPLGKGVGAHRAHQVLFVALLKILTGLRSLSWGPVIRDGLGPDTPLSPQQQGDVGAHMEFREFVAAIQAGKLATQQDRVKAWAHAQTAKESRDGTTNAWQPIMDGFFHKLRMVATYADLGAGGVAASDPSTIDAGTAEFLCTGAFGMLTVVSIFVIGPRLKARQQEWASSIPNDVTGAALVVKIVEAFRSAAAAAKAA